MSEAVEEHESTPSSQPEEPSEFKFFETIERAIVGSLVFVSQFFVTMYFLVFRPSRIVPSEGPRESLCRPFTFLVVTAFLGGKILVFIPSVILVSLDHGLKFFGCPGVYPGKIPEPLSPELQLSTISWADLTHATLPCVIFTAVFANIAAFVLRQQKSEDRRQTVRLVCYVTGFQFVLTLGIFVIFVVGFLLLPSPVLVVLLVAYPIYALVAPALIYSTAVREKRPEWTGARARFLVPTFCLLGSVACILGNAVLVSGMLLLFPPSDAPIVARENESPTDHSTTERPGKSDRTGAGTTEHAASSDVKAVLPGEMVAMRVELVTPMALERGLRFLVREGNRTVAAGTVTTLFESVGGRSVIGEPWPTHVPVEPKKDERRLQTSRNASEKAPKRGARTLFDRTKPHVNVCALGRPEDGTFTFSAAITLVLAEDGLARGRDLSSIRTAAEELDREGGIRLKMAHIEYETPNRHFAHAVFATHEDCMKSLVTGAAAIDGAILVVSVANGLTPEAREQIRLVAKLRVPYLSVFLDVGASTSGDAMTVKENVQALLAKHEFAEDASFFEGLALAAVENPGDQEKSDCIRRLLAHLDEHTLLPIRQTDRPFLMRVEDVFSEENRGTFASGRIERGSVRPGEAIEILGLSERVLVTTVSGVKFMNKTLSEGLAGDNVGCLLHGLAKKDVHVGQVLAKPGTIRLHDTFEAEVYFLAAKEKGRSKPLGQGYRPQFYFRNIDVTGTVTWIE